MKVLTDEDSCQDEEKEHRRPTIYEKDHITIWNVTVQMQSNQRPARVLCYFTIVSH